MATSAAAGLLGRQLKQMQSDKDIPGISCGLVDNNVFEWEVMLMISDDCKFYGGTYVAKDPGSHRPFRESIKSTVVTADWCRQGFGLGEGMRHG